MALYKDIISVIISILLHKDVIFSMLYHDVISVVVYNDMISIVCHNGISVTLHCDIISIQT